jgi:dihydropteroate synthase
MKLQADLPPRTLSNWQLSTRCLELGRRTLVMGVVNITPDSFSDGGSFLAPDAAIAHALQFIEEGADIVDLGAESTRPGSRAGGGPSSNPGSDSGSDRTPAVSAEQEQARLLPVLEGILHARPNAVLSVDTYKAATAHAALAAGAEIVNDVSGFTWDAAMPGICADARCGVILMHTRERPDAWRTLEKLAPEALLATVRSGLAKSLETAAAAGIPPDAVILDPGYGFGKRLDENFVLLARQREFLSLGRPLLAGVSRKSFLGHALTPLYGGHPAPIAARETASLAALVAAILHGASIIRTHNVRPAVEAATIADAILAAH